MQNRVKKQVAGNEVESAKDSPYRMGNWTVTMLKEELRVRQLPISGKKSELIDRLENSPTKTTAAPNTRSSPSKGSPLKGLVESMQVKLLEKKTESPLKKTMESPLKKTVESPMTKTVASALFNEPSSPSIRGRSRSASPAPAKMIMTRSRSTSLSRGTLLTLSRAPASVLSNFFLTQVDVLRANAMFVGSLTVLFAAVAGILTFNLQYQAIFLEQFTRVQPVLQVFNEGFLSNLGFTTSEFSLYVSKASRFMYDCASGNIERNSATGRLRCSAAVLSKIAGGLPGRLFWLTREQFVAWSLGSLVASILVFSVARKCRTALPITNNRFRKFLNFSARFSFLIAAICPFEAVGLISGLSGFENSKFAGLLALKAFIAIPLQFASRILAAKHQKTINFQFERLPSLLKMAITFLAESIHVLKARQVVNGVIYALLCAAAIQVIANTRVYKNLRVKRN